MLKFGVIDYVSTIYKTTESYLFVGIGFEGGGYVLGGGCCLWVAWVFWIRPSALMGEGSLRIV